MTHGTKAAVLFLVVIWSTSAGALNLFGGASQAALGGGAGGLGGLAQAGLGGGGGAPPGIGASVKGFGVATVPSGILSTRFQVAADNNFVANSVIKAIDQVGQALATGQKHQIEANANLLSRMTQDIETLFKEQFKANRASDRQERYGSASRPVTACASPQLGQGVGQGRINERGLAGLVGDAQAKYDTSVTKAADTREHLNTLEIPDTQANSLIPIDNSIKNKTNALNFITTAINPTPDINLAKDLQTTGAGRQYMAAKTIKDTRLSLPEKLIRQVMLNYLPSLPLGQWATQAWNESGHSGSPPSVVNGRISPMALDDLTVSLRAGNANWYKSVNGKLDNTGLLRELVIMNAQRMRMAYQRLQLQNELDAMMAMHVAAAQHAQNKGKMHALRNAAVVAGGHGGG